MPGQRRKYLLLDGTTGWYVTKDTPPGAVRYDTLKRKRRYRLSNGEIVWYANNENRPNDAVPCWSSPRWLYLLSNGTTGRFRPHEAPEKSIRITRGILKIYTLNDFTLIQTISEKIPDNIIFVQTIDRKGRELVLEIYN